MYKEQLTREDLLAIYRFMVLSRRTEEYMVELHQHTPITELPHTGIGQEAVMVGSSYGLRRDDQVMPAHRSRGVFFVKGVTSREMMAAAYAKDVRFNRGKNTSHHIGDKELGLAAGSGIIGSQFPVATGIGLAAKLQHKDYVSVVYFGDGATNRGDFHESVNLAGAMDLPVIYVCENNQYAISTPISKSTKAKHLADRALGYGIPGVTIDGNDVLEVYETMQTAVARARAGEGPTLIECMTYRFRGHSERDFRDLRPQEEIDAWKAKCPIARFRSYLIENGYATEEELEEIGRSVDAEVTDAGEYALNAPYAPADILLKDVFEEKEAQ